MQLCAAIKDLGDNPPVMMAKCPQSTGAQSAKYGWAYHPEVPGGPGGFIRPWVLRPKKLLCTALSPAEFHHFDRIELDLRGHTHVRGAAFSCPRLKLADMVLI